jgi:glycosyltransferase involved in cell wall biosynthesis
MRTKHAPEKGDITVPKFPEVTLGMVTHIGKGEYYNDKLDVIRLSLSTMLAGARDYNYELVIWDNGSPDELKRIIREEFKPTIFIESINVGAHDGRHCIAAIARGKYLSMSDDDVLFFPGWLDKQMEVLKAYPEATVAGSPFRAGFGKATSSNDLFIKKNEKIALGVERGHLIPDQWLRDFAISVGRDPDEYLATQNDEKNRNKDVLLKFNGVKAWAHGHHLQVLGRTNKIAPHFHRDELLVNTHKNFNSGPDGARMLNLCTRERTAIHIGNMIDESIKQIVRDEWKKSPVILHITGL